MKRFFGFIERHPMLTLAFIAPIFCDLLTGITPPPVFFHPFNILLDLLPVSLAAVLIHDLTVRWKSGWKGLLLLALAFGILRTVFFSRDIFDPTFAAADEAFANDFVWNINWTTYMLFIHVTAIFGIIIPIKLTAVLSPKTKDQLWLNNAGMGICIGGIAAKITNNFLQKTRVAIPVPQAAVFAFIVLLCIIGAIFLREKKSEIEGSGKSNSVMNAVSGILLIALPILFAGFPWYMGPNSIIFIASVSAAVFLLLYFVNNRFLNLSDFAVFYFISGAVIFITVYQLFRDYIQFQGYAIIIFIILLFFHLARLRLKERNED
jgi:hypothetical protein